MRRRGRRGGAIALLLASALLAAACTSDGSDSATTSTVPSSTTAPTSTSSSTTSTTTVPVPAGGAVTLGAEQEPDCADWIGDCAGSAWGAWTMGYQTMPRAFDVVDAGSGSGDWRYRPSVLLAGEPDVVTGPKQVVSYRLAPAAVWSDGQPITSTDFRYTWDQIRNGTDIYDRSGYVEIESVDDSVPNVAVVTFRRPYAKWRGLFGGQYGVLPSHLLQGQDRHAAMKDGYTWSGGPWKIESWQKGVSVTLVPNDEYFGPKPRLDKVVFRFFTDVGTELAAFRQNEVLAIYPKPSVEVMDALKAGGFDATKTTQIVTERTADFEALWINNAKAPLDREPVRQAIAYALDRDAIVKALFGSIGVEKALQSLQAPILDRYSDPEAFADYAQNLERVRTLMTGDGWTKGSDGVWVRAGQRASLTFTTTSGDRRRELTEEILKQQLEDAGFALTVANQPAEQLFGATLPAGDFQLALYAPVLTDLDPQNCNLFCTKSIPSDANGNAGLNWSRTSDAGADRQLETVDTNLDDGAREAAGKAGDQVLADIATSIPITPLPNISLVSRSIVGPVHDNPITSVFGNLAEWGLQQ